MTLQTRLSALVAAVGADIKSLSGRVTTIEGQNPNRYDTAPIGAVIAYSRKTFPEGYVLADGVRYTKTAYPQGYAAAVVEVAAGNPLWTVRSADETFTVPNLTDKFLYASGANAIGASGGEASHLLSGAESGVPAHGHGINDPGHAHGSPLALAPTTGHGAGSYSQWVAGTDGWAGAGANNGSYIPNGGTGISIQNNAAAAAASPHNNMPPYVVIAQIVKIAGVTSSGGIIQGPTGPAGAPASTPQEAWHIVGAAGEPAFLNGFISHDPAYQPKFRKRPDGVVQLRGLVRGNAGAVAFTLPVGYRPDQIIYALGDNQGTPRELTISTNGDVTVNIGGAGQWFSLGELSFDTGATSFPASIVSVVQEVWHNVGDSNEPAFQNGWVNYDPVSFNPAGFRKDPAGNVYLRGLVKSGAVGTTIFTLPVGYRPNPGQASRRYLFDSQSNATTGRIDVLPDGTVMVQSGNNAWITLDGLVFSTEQTTFPAGKMQPIVLVNALPVGPSDGDEVYFQNAAMAADGIVWHLRYRSGSASPFKWEVVGASDMASESVTGTAHTTSATAYAGIAFSEINMSLPLSGDYDFTWSSVVHGFPTAIGDFRIVAAVAGIGVENTGIGNYANATWYQQYNGKARAKNKAAAAAVTLVFLSASTSIAFTADEKHLFMRPVRVG